MISSRRVGCKYISQVENQITIPNMDFDPPLNEIYKTLLSNSFNHPIDNNEVINEENFISVEALELPLINLSHLMSPNDSQEREKCIREIFHAATTWGFFQVINHGISEEVLKNLSYEERSVFHQPFNTKAQNKFLGLSPNSYRWGNPRANGLNQLSWSEAFHISVADLSEMNHFNNLRVTMEKFAKEASSLSKTLAEILAQNLGLLKNSTYFQENCPPSSSYLRMNRYPPCPHSSSKLIFGLIPHTDSDFLSIVYQDQVGGLQLLKNGQWIAVKPNPRALVVNIGDLFQALSNGIYKSIKHRVVASQVERFSAAFLYCPTNNAIIGRMSYDDHEEEEPTIYRQFTFREYLMQNQKDVQDHGDKVGLNRFLLYGDFIKRIEDRK